MVTVVTTTRIPNLANAIRFYRTRGMAEVGRSETARRSMMAMPERKVYLHGMWTYDGEGEDE